MIITDRFLKTHTGPHETGRFCWRFYARVNPDQMSYYELNFLETRRTFYGTKVERDVWRASISRALSDKDTAKLKTFLRPSDVVRCTAAALRVPL